MEEMDHCKGCPAKEICYAYGTKSESQTCPCTICIVKTMCRLSCNDYDTWLKKVRNMTPWKDLSNGSNKRM